MQFTIEFQTNHLVRALEAVRLEIATPQQMLGSLGESLLRVNQERHAQGLAPDGSPWKELSPLTLQTKRKPRMLFDHGDLLRFQYQVEGDALRLGTNDWKAVFHHFGTKPYTITPKKAKALKFAGMVRKRVNHPGLPARPLVGFPTSDQQLATDIIEDHLTAALNRVR
ncbi:MAG: phage virion morphogenesis protein [Azonexus sp.]|jgi:phage gpG-like protein|nr:phage virion morphogenesis protein [Azonexus sp.]